MDPHIITMLKHFALGHGDDGCIIAKQTPAG